MHVWASSRKKPVFVGFQPGHAGKSNFAYSTLDMVLSNKVQSDSRAVQLVWAFFVQSPVDSFSCFEAHIMYCLF